MDRIAPFFRANPALLGIAVFVVIAAVVLGFFAVMLTRAGMSLKPIVFFGVFLILVAGPQLVWHALRARGLVGDLTWTPAASAPAEGAVLFDDKVEVADGKIANPAVVFGSGYDPDLLSDVRRLFESFSPEAAQMAVFPKAESAIVAVFPTRGEALRARQAYAAMLGRPDLGASGPEDIDVVRAGGDWARIWVAGRALLVWTGADRAALDRRQQASAGAYVRREPATTVPETAGGRTTAAPERRGFVWVAASVPLLVILAALWFFKGSSWASTISPPDGSSRRAAVPELRQRLLAIESAKQPFAVTPGSRADELVVTWRTDAAWLGVMQVGGLRRLHKLVLTLDEAAGLVRVREYSRRLDGQVGMGGLDVAWKRETGITFYQIEHQRIIGAGLDFQDERGRLKPGAAYTFTLQELKEPFARAVVDAGWTWKPVLWEAPPGLRRWVE